MLWCFLWLFRLRPTLIKCSSKIRLFLFVLKSSISKYIINSGAVPVQPSLVHSDVMISFPSPIIPANSFAFPPTSNFSFPVTGSGWIFFSVLFLQAFDALESNLTLGKGLRFIKWSTSGVIAYPVYIACFLKALTWWTIDFGSSLKSAKV